MTLEELSRYMRLGRDKSVRVDVSLAEDFPGYVRTVTLHEGNRVSVEFEVHGMDEGGAYYWATYPGLPEAVQALESLLGPLEGWENFTRTGRYPTKPEGTKPEEGHRKLGKAIRRNAIRLPPGDYTLKSSYWSGFLPAEEA